jgi:hypothetical protein
VSAVFTPQGLYAPRRFSGDQVRPFALRGGIASTYGTAIGIGDPVKLVTGGTYEKAAAGEAISAVFAGWLPEDSSVYEQTYWKASTTYVRAPIFLFWPIEDTLFSIQAVGSVAQTAIGDAADYVAGTLNTNSGKSGAYLSGTLAGAGASAQFKIAGLRLEQGNDWGDTYTIVEVMVNERVLAGTFNTNAI